MGDRNEIIELELREAAATLAADCAELERLWDAQLIAYSSANIYARKAVLLELIRAGVLRLKSHQRRTLDVVFEGDLAIAIGNERSEMIERNGIRALVCSYMNVWIKRPAGWKLLSRYVGRLERPPNG